MPHFILFEQKQRRPTIISKWENPSLYQINDQIFQRSRPQRKATKATVLQLLAYLCTKLRQ